MLLGPRLNCRNGATLVRYLKSVTIVVLPDRRGQDTCLRNLRLITSQRSVGTTAQRYPLQRAQFSLTVTQQSTQALTENKLGQPVRRPAGTLVHHLDMKTNTDSWETPGDFWVTS